MPLEVGSEVYCRYWLNKTNCGTMLVALSCLLFPLLHTSTAYRYWLHRVPNHENIPCPAGVDCGGDNICGAVGHADCVTGEEDSFGEVFRDYEIWNEIVCSFDTDGDGLTNGDEIGDPCCVWNIGDTPQIQKELSHPDSRGSVHGRASCLLAGPPHPEQLGLKVEQVPSTTLFHSHCDGNESPDLNPLDGLVLGYSNLR